MKKKIIVGIISFIFITAFNILMYKFVPSYRGAEKFVEIAAIIISILFGIFT